MILVVANMLVGQTQGPLKDPGATVARPRKSTDSTTTGNDEELPKIPSKLKKDPALTKSGDVAQFKSDVDIVTLDVAVIDNKGHFIPGIPPGNFRVLEDNVPQQTPQGGYGRGADDHRHGHRVQQPVSTVL